MSSAGHHQASIGTRLVQLLAFASLFGLAHLAQRWAPADGGELATLTGLGLLLLGGTLLSEVLETIKLPHLSGYLLAGLIAGPHVTHLLSHNTVERMSQVNALALALIALAGGAELRVGMLARVASSLSRALAIQSFVGLIVMIGVFLALARFIPFAKNLQPSGVLAVALLWGVLAVSRSPSACLGILSQTRAKGRLTDFSVAFVMASDVVVVVLMAGALVFARPLLTPGAEISLAEFASLGHEILGSLAVGTTLGLLLTLYVKFISQNLPLVLLGLGFGMTEFLRYVHIDPLLCFLTVGFIVQNFSEQGAQLLKIVEKTSGVVFVVFFATAGAHLDLPLLGQLWPIALTFFATRALTAVVLSLYGTAKTEPALIRQWGWASMVSQAGLTLGLTVVVTRAFPQLGEGFRSLVIATVALNEMVGPVLFKYALDRAGESHGALERTAEPAPESA